MAPSARVAYTSHGVTHKLCSANVTLFELVGIDESRQDGLVLEEGEAVADASSTRI